MIKVHVLKTMPEYFEAVRTGEKTFEVRYNDRNFGLGDFVVLKNIVTHARLLTRVVYILDDAQYCKPGYVVLGIKLIRK